MMVIHPRDCFASKCMLLSISPSRICRESLCVLSSSSFQVDDRSVESPAQSLVALHQRWATCLTFRLP